MERSSLLFRSIKNACLVTTGFSLIITSLLVLSIENYPWSISSFIELFTNAPVFWIAVTLLPAITTIVVVQAGRRYWSQEKSAKDLLQKEFEEIQEALQLFSQDVKSINSKSLVVENIQKWKSKYHQAKLREKQRSWYIAAMNELDGLLQLSDKGILLDSFIQFITQQVNYLQGTSFLLWSGDTQLLIQQNLWMKDRFLDNPKVSIPVGTGLVGQCFLERREIEMNDMPPQYFSRFSTQDEIHPTDVIILPIKNGSHIEGVIELGGLHKLNPYELSFLRKACERIASTFQFKAQHFSTHQIREIEQYKQEILLQENEIRNALDELLQRENKHIARINELETAIADFQRKELEYKHKMKLYSLINA